MSLGRQFAQKGTTVTGTDGRLVPRITCFKYNRKAHYADHCRMVKEEEEKYNDGVNVQQLRQGEEVVGGDGVLNGVS